MSVDITLQSSMIDFSFDDVTYKSPINSFDYNRLL